MNPVVYGLLGGVFISALNFLGSLFVLAWKTPSQKFLDASLGFAAGVMLAASITSLILPGIEIGGLVPVLIGLVLGAFVMDTADRVLPHEHFVRGREGNPALAKRIRGVWLFIIAITIHNAPEGLAVGVGFGSGNLPEALTLALAIGLQNIPEGFAVAVSAMNVGLGNRFYAVYVGLRSGLVEIPMALLGAAAVYYMKVLLPYAMGFAAGAMLYIVSDEIIPETHSKGHERAATWGVLLGFCVMLTLDLILA